MKRRAYPDHRRFVRSFKCVVANSDCAGGVQCAHVRSGTNGGMGLKPGDEWCIPLCRWHHAEQHRIGEPAFEGRHGIDMKRIAEGFARRSPVAEIREQRK